MKLAKIALRNVFRNRRRSFLSMLAVAVAAMAMTNMFALLEGMKEDLRQNTWNYESGEVRIRNADFDRYEHLNPVHYVVPDYRALTEQLAELPEVGAISPRINVPGMAFRGEEQISTRGIGVDFDLEAEFQDLEGLVARGRLPRPGTSEAVLGAGLARELNVGIGDAATFLTQTRTRSSNAFTVDIVGIADFPMGGLNSSTYILPIEAAGRYLRMGDASSEILLKSSRAGTEALEQAVHSLLGERGVEGMAVTDWTQVSAGYDYLQMADAVYNIVALFFFVLGCTVIINTTMMTIHERVHEIGTLSAMGMRGGELIRLFFTEAAYLGIAGSLLGTLVGVAIAVPLGAIGIDFGGAMETAGMDMSNVLHPVVNIRSTLGVFVFSAVVAMAASFLPATRAARLRPVDALRK